MQKKLIAPKADPSKENPDVVQPKDTNNIAKPTSGVTDVDIVSEMKKSYIDYSMSVIVARALPDVRDGLKPSQLRVLVTMNDLKLSATAHYRKSAKIVGDTAGNYHPHGTDALYLTLVNLAQDFGMRYPLIDGQGNFGTIDGDPPAAQRYTEARMSRYGMLMLGDLEKGSVVFRPNYEGTCNEPVVLPGLFPNLICNGCDGIAVGMATKMPPHNLTEVVSAISAMISKGNKWKGNAAYNRLRQEWEKTSVVPRVLPEQPFILCSSYGLETFEPATEDETLYPKFKTDVDVQTLMEHIQGPDFPTYGIIYNRKDIQEMYETGRGRVIMRAKTEIEELKNGKYAIIVTELPFQTNKAFFVEKIANLVKLQKIKGITALRDESSMEGMRVVIEVAKNAKPQVILNKLFKYTDMQKTFNANMIALVDGEPRMLSLREILEQYISHRMIVIIRRNEYDLAQARYRQHILEGLKIALDFLDEVINTIRNSKNQEDAKINLIKKFGLTEVQAQAILDMQLRRIAALERKRIEEELEQVKTNVHNIVELLSSDNRILEVVNAEVKALGEKYGDVRRTKIIKGALGELEVEDLVSNEPTIVTLSHQGYIKRTPPSSYRTQRRGGKGLQAATTKDTDFVDEVISCNTHDPILFFTSKGKIFEIKTYDIPEYGRQAKGIPVVNLIQIDSDEFVTAVLPKRDMEKSKYLMFATKKGMVKKTEMSAYANIRTNGLISIGLNQGDVLQWVKPSKGNDQVFLVTRNGKAIRFKETDVKPTGRNTKGVTGARFSSKEDYIVSMDVIGDSDCVNLVVSENGYGKFSSIDSYRMTRRGSKGVSALKVTDKTGYVAESKVLKATERKATQLIIVSKKGILIRVIMDRIPTLNRMTQGVRIMKLDKDDIVSSAALVKEEKIEE